MKTEPITRASILRDIAARVAMIARGRLTTEEAAAAIDAFMPSFETIAAAHALTLATEDTSIIRPRLVTAMRELGEEGIEVLNPGTRWANVREAHRALYRELAAEGLLDGRRTA